MSKDHINRFFKKNKLKPRKLNVNSPKLSNATTPKETLTTSENIVHKLEKDGYIFNIHF